MHLLRLKSFETVGDGSCYFGVFIALVAFPELSSRIALGFGSEEAPGSFSSRFSRELA